MTRLPYKVRNASQRKAVARYACKMLALNAWAGNVYTCLYVYIYIHIFHVYICINIYIHIYIYMFIGVHICIFVYLSLRMIQLSCIPTRSRLEFCLDLRFVNILSCVHWPACARFTVDYFDDQPSDWTMTSSREVALTAITLRRSARSSSTATDANATLTEMSTAHTSTTVGTADSIN